MFRTVATLTAPLSLTLGLAGMAFPGQLATVFGVPLEGEVSLALARLACAAYFGFGVLNWMTRDLTDAGAQRAIAAGNGAAWLASAAVSLTALLSTELGTTATWMIAALEIVVASAWFTVLLQRRPVVRASASG